MTAHQFRGAISERGQFYECPKKNWACLSQGELNAVNGAYSKLAGYGKQNLPVFNKININPGLFENCFQRSRK